MNGKLRPYETVVLETVCAALPFDMQQLCRRQIARINRVQRLLEWNEVEFYCMRWFKVRWPEDMLFAERGEFVLAKGRLVSRRGVVGIRVWSVGGHVFSIESDQSLRPYREASDTRFEIEDGVARLRR